VNTPAHLIFGLTAFGTPATRSVTAAALLGAMIPDACLYLMAGWHLNVLDTPARVVFDELYYSESWQAVFRIDNSFVLWGIAFVLALAFGARWAVALTGAALLHLFLDFPLHHNDGRAHFWPISTWIFQSPVSYWDPAHYGRIVGALEASAVIAASLVLWHRYAGRWMRALICVLAEAQIGPSVMFASMYSA